ncbi:MAG: hypothetical protein EZS28_019845 [Streblomastix strix]|uniref:Uncharacterized protein n=1 Tax=Streblomastix strix TaxID=222440 RepID=A0A5J4VQK1_9EUKA|nr:MAG: hypothetical protein EZS28_019845 [Streblomastix strix]
MEQQIHHKNQQFHQRTSSYWKTLKQIYPPSPHEYVLEILLSIVVVSPLAHNISVADPYALMNLVAVTFHSYANYWGYTWSCLAQKADVPLALTPLRIGIFETLVYTLIGSEWSFPAQQLVVPTDPLSLSCGAVAVRSDWGVASLADVT